MCGNCSNKTLIIISLNLYSDIRAVPQVARHPDLQSRPKGWGQSKWAAGGNEGLADLQVLVKVATPFIEIF